MAHGLGGHLLDHVQQHYAAAGHRLHGCAIRSTAHRFYCDRLGLAIDPKKLICDGCKDRPGHTAEDCEDAQHPHRAYDSCPCQHREPPATPTTISS